MVGYRYQTGALGASCQMGGEDSGETINRLRQTDDPIDLLRCPVCLTKLRVERDAVVCVHGLHRYRVEDEIPLFAEQFCSAEGREQQAHYDKIAAAFVANLSYPHTTEYMRYLDKALLDVVDDAALGPVAELCCGRGEAFHL